MGIVSAQKKTKLAQEMQTALPVRFARSLCHLLLTLVPASYVCAKAQSPSQVLLAIRPNTEASVSPSS